MPYRTIVVGTDGSDRAHAAVRTAAELAGSTGAALVVVTAYAPVTSARRLDEPSAPAGRVRFAEHDEAMQCARQGATIAHEAGATDVDAAAAPGPPADALLAVTSDRHADLVVVGSRGMTDVSRFVLGSVANEVSHHATCDVLVVHTEDS